MRRAFLMVLLVGLAVSSCGDASGQRCGGNTSNAPTCPSGYSCVSATEGGPPVGDVGGICRKNDAAGR